MDELRITPMEASLDKREYQRLARLEPLTLAHVLVMVLISSWYFGGASRGAENILIGGGVFAAVLLLLNLRARHLAGRSRRCYLWLLPVLLFNGLVAISCANPSFTARIYEGVPMLAQTGSAHTLWPSTIYAPDTWRRLFLFDACFLTAFNVLLSCRRRRGLLFLIAAIVGNGSILAVFGTVQKFSANGLYFGAVASPNSRFFATFVYGNHWSAYATLVFASAAGWISHARAKRLATGERHSAEPILYLTLFVCALTPFINGSRAGMLLLSAGAVGVALMIWRTGAEARPNHIWQLRAVILACLLVLGGFGYELGSSMLRERWMDTEEQWRGQPLRGREELYRDTWKLFREHPLFGWGLGSFGKAYLAEHPRSSAPSRQYERSYANAHSDWLETLADMGGVGAILLGATLLLPAITIYSWKHRTGFDSALLCGCAAVLLYALVEFPFGNSAVCLLWWVSYFAALQYHRLSRKQAERVMPSTR